MNTKEEEGTQPYLSQTDLDPWTKIHKDGNGNQYQLYYRDALKKIQYFMTSSQIHLPPTHPT